MKAWNDLTRAQRKLLREICVGEFAVPAHGHVANRLMEMGLAKLSAGSLVASEFGMIEFERKGGAK